MHAILRLQVRRIRIPSVHCARVQTEIVEGRRSALETPRPIAPHSFTWEGLCCLHGMPPVSVSVPECVHCTREIRSPR